MAKRDPEPSDEPLVRDIMQTEVVTICPEATVKEFAELMRRKKVGGAPVVDAEGTLLGIATDGDLMALDAELHFPHYIQFLDSLIYIQSQKKFEERLRKAAAATVADVMTKDVFTVTPDDPARKAATLMSDHGIGRIPVEVDGKVVGIVTRHDVLRLLDL
ncbi:MAG: CBS domain-containing protein [Thermoleophilia bacterium]|jgi:CBS domain-containing protein|nr:CBS domain-containing protein [Thermoleophilia bacterium]